MTNEELTDALDGLYAYDKGATDSGIHDEELRSRAYAALRDMAEWDRRAFVCEFVIDRCLSEPAREQGYGPEDALEFLRWLEDEVPSAILYVGKL